MKIRGQFYPRSFNMGFSREMYEKLGGFHDDLRHGQDIEFSHRLIKAGANIVYVYNAPVCHKRRSTIPLFFKQTWNWGVARINLYHIDKDMLKPIHFLNSIAVIFFPVLIPVIIIGFFDCLIKYRSIRVALWLPIVIPVQVFGYGLGFIYRGLTYDKRTKKT